MAVSGQPSRKLLAVVDVRQPSAWPLAARPAVAISVRRCLFPDPGTREHFRDGVVPPVGCRCSSIDHKNDARLPRTAPLLPCRSTMSHRQSLPVIGRLLTVAVAMVVVAGISDCARFGSATRDGSLDETLYPTRPRVTLGEVMSGAAGTYIDRLLADRDSTIERWPDHVARPLTIWIDTASELSGILTHYPETVRTAFAQWATTGIPLRFAFVSSSRNADIRVHWTDRLPHKTGSTTWRTDRSGILT